MKHLTTLILTLSLTACNTASQQAERELAMLEKNHASSDRICTASRKVADAYLAENNADKFPLADVVASTDCLTAQLDRMD